MRIPFKVAGRSFEGADCYGLYRLLFLDAFGKELPKYDYYNSTETEQSNNAINDNLDCIFTKSEKLFGSMVLMQKGGLISHVGFYLGNNQMIHTTEAKGVQIVDIRHKTIKEAIKGFYFVQNTYM